MNANILLIEDHDTLRVSLEMWLNHELPHCTIVTAKNGREAILLVKKFQPTLVITDLNMPELDGIETTRYLLRDVPTLDVVVLTGCEGEAYRAKALEAGAKAYLAKQHISATLLPVITELLSGGKNDEYSQ